MQCRFWVQQKNKLTIILFTAHVLGILHLGLSESVDADLSTMQDPTPRLFNLVKEKDYDDDGEEHVDDDDDDGLSLIDNSTENTRVSLFLEDTRSLPCILCVALFCSVHHLRCGLPFKLHLSCIRLNIGSNHRTRSNHRNHRTYIAWCKICLAVCI